MTEQIPERLIAAFEGSYELVRPLGEGGMATVYLANDLKHGRQVAIKVLKPELAAVIGGERFVAEIRTTAGLQHPHILPLFDSGEADSFLFYVMPYVEGETLRDRLDRERQLGVDEALRITRDVADALDYAHRQGVIHRDIKPENILLHDGRPVVADFGIAVAISAAGGGRMTETGLSLGTPHYMSPEQATADRDLTIRSDVYSLSCVLYEMLAGDPPHTGPTAQAILVRILTETPRPVNDTRTSVPPHIAAVLAKGLEKLPADRFDSAAEFRLALDRTDFTYTAVAPQTGVAAGVTQPVAPSSSGGTRGGGRAPLVPILGGAAALFAALALFGWLRPAPSPAPSAVLMLSTTGWELAPRERVTVSADGSTFLTVGRPEGIEDEDHILIRGIEDTDFRSVTVAEEIYSPTFSPDGSRIAYVDGQSNEIRAVSVGGGGSQSIWDDDGAQPSELAWGDDGYIYFWSEHIQRVPDTGGSAEIVLENAGWAYNPTPLPGGRALLLTDDRGDGVRVSVFEIGADSARPLLPEAALPTWVQTGHLVYGHPDGGLQAVPFDLDRLEVTGLPTPVREGVSLSGPAAFYALSANGTLVYTEGRVGGLFGGPADLFERDLVTGVETRVPLESRLIDGVSYAPDGDRIVFGGGDPGDTSMDDLQILSYDLRLGLTPTAWTTQGRNDDPIWSPDSRRIAFVRFPGSAPRIMVRDVTSETAAVPLLDPDENPGLPPMFQPAWASDSILVFQREGGPGADLWMVDLASGTGAIPYLEEEWTLFDARVSPAGDRVVYVNRGQYDQPEVLVRSFPDPGPPVRVSQGLGVDPRWHPDGQSIFYLARGEAARALHRAWVSYDPVFTVDSTSVVIEDIELRAWDLHPDGSRIILTRGAESDEEEDGENEPETPERHIVVLNWFEELKERLGND